MRARLACHRCVGSHVLLICRFLNLDLRCGGSLSWFRRILGRGGRVVTVTAPLLGPSSPVLPVCPSPSLSFALAFSAFIALLLFFSASIPNLFAVSARIRALVVLGFLRFESTTGVLSSAISFKARLRSLLGTLFALWLAVRRLSPRGTCWNARLVASALVCRMLSSSARISNSRAFRKDWRSSSPSRRAASEDCAAISRSWRILTRFCAHPPPPPAAPLFPPPLSPEDPCFRLLAKADFRGLDLEPAADIAGHGASAMGGDWVVASSRQGDSL
ncbi:hypothetical protein BDP67DRAFT_521109 [Colletotrichum lupini]|nr:hypothetical protein BDP67DRAFT_521109 [Colletotrichum lupini]